MWTVLLLVNNSKTIWDIDMQLNGLSHKILYQYVNFKTCSSFRGRDFKGAQPSPMQSPPPSIACEIENTKMTRPFSDQTVQNSP